MTFEQYFKNIFKNDLEAIFGGKFKVFVTNDITFREFHKNEILVVIKTGQGTTSGVENVIATNSVASITFKYETIYQQEILSALTNYVNEITGKFFETEDGLIFKLGFATPYVIGSSNVENVDNDSTYTSFAQIVGNIFYSDLAQPEPKYIYYDMQDLTHRYELVGLQNYQDNENYTYSYSDTKDKYGYQSFSNKSRVITFQIYSKNNDLCKWLRRKDFSNKSFLFQIGADKTEENNVEPEQLSVLFQNNTYAEQNGVGVISVSLLVETDTKD